MVFLRRFVLPVSLLSGTIIGAGVFSLPFVFVASGWAIGLAYLAGFGAVFTLIHLMYADILLADGEHDFVGYARRYLGRWAGRLAFLMTVVGMLFALTVYLVLAKSFFAVLAPSLFPELALLGFWAFGSLVMFFPVRGVAALEVLAVLVIIGIIGVITVYGVPQAARLAELPAANLWYLFLPFGPVLFSYSGRVAIPSLLAYLKREAPEPAHMRKVIGWGTAIPGIVYLLFALGIIGLSQTVSEDAVSGILGLPPFLLRAIGAFGIASLISSYLVVGISVMRVLEKDLAAPRLFSAPLVIGAPLALYAAGLQDFLTLVSVSGGVFIALEGVFIALMWRKARAHLLLSPRFTYAVGALVAVFIGGALYEIMRVL
ncbi:MAG: hypothetical protein HYT14_01440 [Candidatus Liptonbacteria bacterium]|nr:hypothetical protein [Candidatus Liptonbacteria bacterium]